MINTIYLDYAWFSGDVSSNVGLTDDQRNDYIYMLQDNGINQQFCDIGVLNDDGTLPPEGTRQLKEWIHLSRLVDPRQSIILVLNYGKRKSNVKFGTASYNATLNTVIHELMTTYRPDGIHLDIEAFLANDTKIIALLALLKAKSLAKAHLSISVPADIWTDSYVTQVAQIVDQINPMIYDTMGWGSEVVDVITYQEYFKSKLLRYSTALHFTNCQLVPTLPAYEMKVAVDGTIYHDPDIESMKATIEVLRQVLWDGAKISGAGIFWGSHYLGLHPDIYKQYTQDQHEWQTNWLV